MAMTKSKCTSYFIMAEPILSTLVLSNLKNLNSYMQTPFLEWRHSKKC